MLCNLNRLRRQLSTTSDVWPPSDYPANILQAVALPPIQQLTSSKFTHTLDYKREPIPERYQSKPDEPIMLNDKNVFDKIRHSSMYKIGQQVIESHQFYANEPESQNTATQLLASLTIVPETREIKELVVCKEKRRLGIGSALLDYAFRLRTTYTLCKYYRSNTPYGLTIGMDNRDFDSILHSFMWLCPDFNRELWGTTTNRIYGKMPYVKENKHSSNDPMDYGHSDKIEFHYTRCWSSAEELLTTLDFTTLCLDNTRFIRINV